MLPEALGSTFIVTIFIITEPTITITGLNALAERMITGMFTIFGIFVRPVTWTIRLMNWL